jgi:DNA replication protein DnaC
MSNARCAWHRSEAVIAHLHAPGCSLPRCLVCKSAIAANPVVTSYRGQRVELHALCWKEVEAKHLARRALAERRLEGVLSSLPQFAVLPDSQEFAERVREPRLRNAAERYRVEKHGNLVLLGPAGCGKTMVAASIIKRSFAEAVAAFMAPVSDSSKLEYAVRVVWTSAADLHNSRRQHRLGEGEAPEFLRAEMAPLLVLDELGQEIADDRWLLEFLNARYNRGLPTISTSGLTRPELEKRYGAGAVRRLIEPTGRFVDIFDACRSDAGER